MKIDPLQIKNDPDGFWRSLPTDTLKATDQDLLTNDSYKITYRHDFAAWIYDCIKWGSQKPTKYQLECAEELIEYLRLAIRSPHGTGKTALAAWATLWFSTTREGQNFKIPTTASAWRQLEKYLWPEIHKWISKLDWWRIGRDPFTKFELLTLSLKLRGGEAFAVASDNHALIEGAHADSLLYLFDEAKAIPIKTWDAAEGAFSTAGEDTPDEAYALAISTPGEPAGRFYDIHKRKPGYEDWHVKHIDLKDAIHAGRVSYKWAEQRKRQWGENSAIYQNRVLGEFASSSEHATIPLAWIEAAVERWHALNDSGELEKMQAKYIAADIADTGENQTVIAERSGNVILMLHKHSKEDNMQTAGRIIAVKRKNSGEVNLTVDSLGVGAGVVSRLNELHHVVFSFVAGESTPATDRSGSFGFANLRSAAWWNMRELLDPENNENVALPPDDQLIGDLTAPGYKFTSNGRIMVEPKGENLTFADTNIGGKGVKQRLGRSTDCGDAVVMCMWEGQKVGIIV